ncbi:MAG: hypothetical protein GY832_02430 [Chloroflexi bacterium]|nr:hypothetical protein [Chloroflexota bacterium]
MSIKRCTRWSAILTFTVGLALSSVLLLLSGMNQTHAGASTGPQGIPQASSMMTRHSSPVELALNTPWFSDNRPNSPHSQNAHLTHYIIFEMWPDGSIHPLEYKLVQSSAALNTLSNQDIAKRLQEPRRDIRQLEITLESSQGRTVYQNVVQVPRWLRGEFHAKGPMTAQAPIDGHFFPLERPIFVVRVPVIADTSLAMRASRAKTSARFDLEKLSRDTPKIHIEPTTQLYSGQSSGSSANRVDLLILGDGYTATLQTKFANDAASVAADLFGISPYAEYSNYVITHSLYVSSAQAGADHPPYQAGCSDTSCCADPTMLSDPLQGTFVDTAFDARFCTSNIHRLLTVDYAKVFAAAAAVPDWDEILVIVNDPTYGGAGGYFAVVSAHSSAPQIAQHELGHSFVGLADEYESPYPGYPACSDISDSPCEANVTDVVTRSSIKWSPWISPSTPIPTEPEFDPSFADVVGLFEGARYLTTDIYRSGQNCIMRSLGAPYCQVPSQAYVLTLYGGGWGVPSSGISLIEPGSPAPTTDTITLWYPGNQIFGADILQPIGGPPASIQWMVNGVPDPITDTDTFTYTPVISDVGNNVEIQLLVQDMTPLVHPAMAGTLLQSNHIWTVNVNAAPSTVAISSSVTGTVYVDYAFTATVNPTTTIPITYVWQATGQSPVTNTSDLSDTVVFTWIIPGRQSITVTALNAGGTVTGTHAITLNVQPPTDVMISGPEMGLVNTTDVFTAAVVPPTVTLPITYTWSPVPEIGQGTARVTFTWAMTGPQTIAVTATNAAGVPVSDTHTIVVNVPLADVAINGPETGLVDTTGVFTTTVVPPTATLPITYTWSPVPEIGQGTAKVTFTWAMTGPQTIVVTATNAANVPVSDTHTIVVNVPLADVAISGPETGVIDTTDVFTAMVVPPTATLPISYTWSPVPESGQGTDRVTFTWATIGSQTIVVTATNVAGVPVSDTHTIEIEKQRIYLSIVLRTSGP